jgi:Zn-dependent M28 family amino/carboxypeptidase
MQRLNHAFLWLLLPCLCAATTATSFHDGPGAHASASASLPAPANDDAIAKGLRDGKAWSYLEELCRVAPHRLSGSKGLDDALDWGERMLKAIPGAQVRRVPCLVPHWERGAVERLQIVGEQPEARTPLPILALGGSVGTPEAGIEAPVVRVAVREDLAKLGESAKGCIVFFDEPFDAARASTGEAYGRAVWQRARGASEAAKLGAVAVIVRSVSPRLDDHPHTGAMRYEEGVARIPAAAVSTLGAERLAAALARGPLKLKLELSCRSLPDKPSANIVADLPGVDPAAGVVLLSGHIDAWDVGQGAHDDGAGCVHAIEALRLAARDGWKHKRGLRVVLYTNEENGVRGGEAQRDATPQGEVRLALESDSGGFAPIGLSIDGPEALIAALRDAGRALEPIAAGMVIKGGGGVDVGPLKERGAAVGLLLISGARYFDYHHADSDRLEAVHPRELQLGAVAFLHWARVAADLPEELFRSVDAKAGR